MPMTNYFNPNSFKPDSSGLQMTNAYDVQRDRQRYEEMVGLQKMLTQMELAKQHEELTQGRPVRQAQRGAQTSGFDLERMINQGTNPNVMAGGRMGTAMGQEAAGRTAMGTLDTAIPAAKAANRVRTLDDEARTLEYLAGRGPLEVAEYYKKFRDAAPDWVGLPEVYNPKVPQRLREIENLRTRTPDYRQKEDLENVKGAWDVEKQRVANEGQVASARARQTQKTLDYDQALKKASTTAHIASIAAQISNDPDVPQEQKDSLIARARAAYDVAVKLEASRAQARTPGIEQSIQGTIGDDVLRRLQPTEPGTPPPGGAGGQPTRRLSMSDLRRLYPNIPDAKLKEAYKKKYGFDPLP